MAAAAPALIPIPQVEIRGLCKLAAASAGKKEAWRIEQFRSALGGIANLYCHRAMSTDRSAFVAETEFGFVTSEVSRDEILAEIGHCTGAGTKVCESILKGFEHGLAQVFAENGWQRYEISGLGVFIAVEPGCGRYVLQYELPLARFFGNTATSSLGA